MVENNKKIIQNGFWHINVQEFVCGWSASLINITVTYPVYKIMFRQVNQHENHSFEELKKFDSIESKVRLFVFSFRFCMELK